MRRHLYLRVVRTLVLGFSLLCVITATAEPPTTQPRWTPRLQFRVVLSAGEQGDAEELVNPYDGTKIQVLKEGHLSERDLARVRPSMDRDGTINISMEFTEAGAARMEQFTTANVHHRVAIVLDGKILAAPNVQTPIRDAAIITGGQRGFTHEQAGELTKQIEGAMHAAPTTRP